jgi:P pilus assembly chaperone PapD
MKKVIFTIILPIYMLVPYLSTAQITIAPTNMFIEGNNRFGTYMVINNSNEPQEVGIDFTFSYAQTNTDGNRKTVTEDSVVSAQYSLSQYVRAFPKNFILQPNQRQVVRIRLNLPSDLPDGTYWSRIVTSATPQSPPVEIGSSDAVTAQVGITIRQITGLFYKKGSVSTGIEVERIRTQSNDGILTVLTDFQRTGNSPFLGSIFVSIFDQAGSLIKEDFVSTSLYFDGTHRQRLDVSDLPTGEYNIQVKFESRRTDIPRSDLIQIQPEIFSTTVNLP